MRLGFVRHFSEQDVIMDAELRAAVDQALDVLRALGAEVEDVTLRPLQAYYDVRNVITETDCFSLHLKQLRTDPRLYGRQFLSRCLPACLFSASDYVNAQRERRKMMLEIHDTLRDYDALITVGAGPAPKLDAFRPGARDLTSNHAGLIGASASLAGLPVLAMCCGFSRSGLPLGLQIMGRPWEDDVVLAIGKAYEVVTSWRDARPRVARADASAVEHRAAVPSLAVDEGFRSCVATAAREAGLQLDDETFSLLLAAAPQALEMARRIPRDFDYTDELPTVFHPILHEPTLT